MDNLRQRIIEEQVGVPCSTFLDHFTHITQNYQNRQIEHTVNAGMPEPEAKTFYQALVDERIKRETLEAARYIKERCDDIKDLGYRDAKVIAEKANIKGVDLVVLQAMVQSLESRTTGHVEAIPETEASGVVEATETLESAETVKAIDTMEVPETAEALGVPGGSKLSKRQKKLQRSKEKQQDKKAIALLQVTSSADQGVTDDKPTSTAELAGSVFNLENIHDQGTSKDKGTGTPQHVDAQESSTFEAKPEKPKKPRKARKSKAVQDHSASTSGSIAVAQGKLHEAEGFPTSTYDAIVTAPGKLHEAEESEAIHDLPTSTFKIPAAALGTRREVRESEAIQDDPTSTSEISATVLGKRREVRESEVIQDFPTSISQISAAALSMRRESGVSEASQNLTSTSRLSATALGKRRAIESKSMTHMELEDLKIPAEDRAAAIERLRDEPSPLSLEEARGRRTNLRRERSESVTFLRQRTFSREDSITPSTEEAPGLPVTTEQPVDVEGDTHRSPVEVDDSSVRLSLDEVLNTQSSASHKDKTFIQAKEREALAQRELEDTIVSQLSTQLSESQGLAQQSASIPTIKVSFGDSEKTILSRAELDKSSIGRNKKEEVGIHKLDSSLTSHSSPSHTDEPKRVLVIQESLLPSASDSSNQASASASRAEPTSVNIEQIVDREERYRRAREAADKLIAIPLSLGGRKKVESEGAVVDKYTSGELKSSAQVEDFTTIPATSRVGMFLSYSAPHLPELITGPAEVMAGDEKDLIEEEAIAESSDHTRPRTEPHLYQPWAGQSSWAYKTTSVADKRLIQRAYVLYEKPQTYINNEPLPDLPSGTPAIILPSRTSINEVVMVFDERVKRLAIEPHPEPWEDLRTDVGHPDWLPDGKLCEYQVAEELGFRIWRHDRETLVCNLPSCGKVTQEHVRTTRICHGCGPKTRVRYCSKVHLLADMEGHWQECGEKGLVIPRIIDDFTAPARFAKGFPAIKDVRGFKSAARHRQRAHAILNGGQYTLFEPQSGDAIRVVWPETIAEEMFGRIERLLNIALHDRGDDVLVSYLYRVLRNGLKAMGLWGDEISSLFANQFYQEFGFDASLRSSTALPLCQCEWVGTAAHHGKCLPTCKGGFRGVGVVVRGPGMLEAVELWEGKHWILRAWRRSLRGVGGWRGRISGEGFVGVLDGQDAEDFRPGLGEGWEGWGCVEDDVCL